MRVGASSPSELKGVHGALTRNLSNVFYIPYSSEFLF
jgi:hypothetical protein